MAGVATGQPIFLRAVKEGYAITNTAYLNPKTEAQIVMLSPAELPETKAPILAITSPADLSCPNVQRFTGSSRFQGVVDINYQPSFPSQPNDSMPNVIVSASSLHKDMVLPAFAGQVSYAVFVGRQAAGNREQGRGIKNAFR
jgi:hypothetical protein